MAYGYNNRIKSGQRTGNYGLPQPNPDPKPDTTSTAVAEMDEIVQFAYLEMPVVLLRAIEVMNGRYGVGEERVQALQAIGVTPSRVQEVVNVIAPYFE